VRAQVNQIGVLLQRNGVTERVSLARVTEDSRENIFMRPGDVVTLVLDAQTFIAEGATGGNTEMQFGSDSLSLAQALVKVGGLNDERADARGVFVFRLENPSNLRILKPDSPLAHAEGKVPVVYHLDLQNPNSLFLQQRFQIANRDVVYISNAPTVQLTKAMAIISGALSPVATTAGTAASAATTQIYLK